MKRLYHLLQVDTQRIILIIFVSTLLATVPTLTHAQDDGDWTRNGNFLFLADPVNDTIGIGTSTPRGWRLEVNGSTVFTPGGLRGEIEFSTPAGETGMVINGRNRADVRFDGGILKLLVGPGGEVPPPSSNGITINAQGKVGIGTHASDYRLRVIGGVNIDESTAAGGDISFIDFETSGDGHRDYRVGVTADFPPATYPTRAFFIADVSGDPTEITAPVRSPDFLIKDNQIGHFSTAGNLNAQIGHIAANSNHGAVAVLDAAENVKASMFVGTGW